MSFVCWAKVMRHHHLSPGTSLLPFSLPRLLLPLLLVMHAPASLVAGQEQSVFPESGYYSYHPHYFHDLPPNRPLPSKIPFGLPVGGYSAGGQGPPFGLVAFYVEEYGHRFDFGNPWHIFMLKQLIRLSSEITTKLVPLDSNPFLDDSVLWDNKAAAVSVWNK